MRSKRTLVVGGSSGTGLAIARALAERGEQVTLTSRSADTANRIAAELGTDHRSLALDLNRPE